MSRESLVRRLPELAFAVLFGGGLVLGGGAALAGIPRLLEVLPGMAAQAEPTPGRDVVRLALPAKFLKSDESGHTPQVLYPVRISPLPAWLTQISLVGLPPVDFCAMEPPTFMSPAPARAT